MIHWKIPLFIPDFTEEDMLNATAPIREGWLTMGERTLAFERVFAEKIDARHAFAVANGTAALHLALVCAGVVPGGEVLVPSLTFVACANTIVTQGAVPVFVDCASKEDWTISPDDIARKITDKTRAILVVHYAGFPCRMDEILALARQHNLAVIEDCAHALFSFRQGQACGTFGDVSAFSFFSNKNMTTGEGGMVVTKHDSYAERLRKIRSHGMTTLTLDRHQGRAISYDVTEPGFNYRIDEIRSALGLSQLQRLEENLRKRQAIYHSYNLRLKDIEAIHIPFLDRNEDEVGYHIYPIYIQNPAIRGTLIEKMKADGIQTSIHYPAIHRFSAYQSYEGTAQCPISERIADGELTLPFYPSMTENEIDMVFNSLITNLRYIS